VNTDSNISNRTFFITMSVLAVALVMTLVISIRGIPRVVETNLKNLPMEINGMEGVDDCFPESVYKEISENRNIYRHYRSDDGRQVDLYIGYYGTAKGGRTGHNPIGCLPSQGWGLQESREIKLKCAYYPDGVSVNYLLSTKEDSIITTIYWYQSAGTKVLSNGIKQNIQRFKDKIFRNRNDGAFVRVTLLSEMTDAETAKSVASTFSERILNLLPYYWPVEN
jgi:EpsI family protein